MNVLVSMEEAGFRHNATKHQTDSPIYAWIWHTIGKNLYGLQENTKKYIPLHFVQVYLTISWKLSDSYKNYYAKNEFLRSQETQMSEVEIVKNSVRNSDRNTIEKTNNWLENILS